jgi:hypothetical protein
MSVGAQHAASRLATKPAANPVGFLAVIEVNGRRARRAVPLPDFDHDFFGQ